MCNFVTTQLRHIEGAGNVRLYGELANQHGAIPGRHVSSAAELVETLRHIPGDTTTPPAPGAVRIGPEDV